MYIQHRRCPCRYPPARESSSTGHHLRNRCTSVKSANAGDLEPQCRTQRVQAVVHKQARTPDNVKGRNNGRAHDAHTHKITPGTNMFLVWQIHIIYRLCDQHHPVDPGTSYATCSSKGVYPHPVIRAVGVSHTACEDEFRRNLRSHNSRVRLFI